MFASLPVFFRRLLVVGALCAAGSLPSACTKATASRRPHTLVVVYPSDANTLNPLFANNEPALLFSRFVFDGLTGIGKSFAIKPALARSWSSTPDHLHWDVHLRRGVRWSDGAPFDARDVVFTWKTMLDPNVGFPYAGQFAYVKHVTARGRYLVRFDLSRANVLFVSQALYSPILPEHILGAIPAAEQRISTFGQHPIGTGAYVLARWRHDDTLMFVRNAHWWGGRAKIPTIVFRIVLDNAARIDAMVDGSADFYPSMAPADYRTLRTLDPDLVYYHVPDLFSRFIMTNDTRPGLDDLTVRRAMMFGWDRVAVVDGLYHGDVLLNDELTAWALTVWHAGDVTHYPYDPARARALLEADGWRPGPDGVRQRRDVRLAFTLKIPIGDAVLANVGAAFQADMRAIGIAIAIQTLDYATFIDQTNAMQYQLALTGWGGTSDPDEFTFLDSSQVEPVGNNDTGYRNARVDRDLRAGLRAFDPARRRALYDDYARVTSATLPVLWGYDEKFSAAYNRRLHIDLREALPDISFFWNAADWTLSP